MNFDWPKKIEPMSEPTNDQLDIENELYDLINKAVRLGISPVEFRKLCSDMWFQASTDYIKESWN